MRVCLDSLCVFCPLSVEKLPTQNSKFSKILLRICLGKRRIVFPIRKTIRKRYKLDNYSKKMIIITIKAIEIAKEN